MNLREKITADLLNSMKAKEEMRVGALRMLKSAVMKFEVSGKEKHDATDEEVMQIIAREVKQRRDSIDAFKKGGREEMAAKEEDEMKILQAYLPTQLSEEEVKNAVSAIINNLGATSKAEMGKVIGAAMKELKGKADGQLVSKVVGEMLK